MMKRLIARTAIPAAGLLTPFAAFAADSEPMPIPEGPSSISAFYESACTVTNWIFAFALVAAIIAIIFAGVSFYSSGGDSSKVTQARQFLIWALVGVAIAILAKALVAITGSLVGVAETIDFLCTA